MHYIFNQAEPSAKPNEVLQIVQWHHLVDVLVMNRLYNQIISCNSAISPVFGFSCFRGCVLGTRFH